MEELVLLVVDYMDESFEVKTTLLTGTSQEDALKNLIESGYPFEVKHVGTAYSITI